MPVCPCYQKHMHNTFLQHFHTCFTAQASHNFGSATKPVALVAKILQHVPQKKRLCQCALVCTAWATPAAQATVHVNRKLRSSSVPSLQRWLEVHAGQVLSVRLRAKRAVSRHKLKLPVHKLTKLQQLHLEGFRLQLPCKGRSSDAGSSCQQRS